MTRKQLMQARAQVLFWHEMGAPYDFAVYMLAQFLKRNGIPITERNLRSPFKVAFPQRRARGA